MNETKTADALSNVEEVPPTFLTALGWTMFMTFVSLFLLGALLYLRLYDGKLVDTTMTTAAIVQWILLLQWIIKGTDCKDAVFILNSTLGLWIGGILAMIFRGGITSIDPSCIFVLFIPILVRHYFVRSNLPRSAVIALVLQYPILWYGIIGLVDILNAWR